MKEKLLRITKFTFSSKSTLLLSLEIIIGFCLLLFSVFVFADIVKDTFIDREVSQFDRDLSYLIYSLRTPFLTQIMIIISTLGADLTIAFGAVIAIVLTWKKHKREFLLFSVTLLFGGVFNYILKELFQRPRPTFDPLLTLSTFSFPSGHAMNSFVFYSLVAYFFYHFTQKTKLSILVAFFCAVMILLVGLSRIYLGVHYPSDVIAGYAVGLLWFMIVLLFGRTMTYFNLIKKFKEI